MGSCLDHFGMILRSFLDNLAIIFVWVDIRQSAKDFYNARIDIFSSKYFFLNSMELAELIRVPHNVSRRVRQIQRPDRLLGGPVPWPGLVFL